MLMCVCCQGNHSVIGSPDEYTITIQSQRGLKEFSFDQVFTPEHSQEKVFEDTNVSVANVAISGVFYSMAGGVSGLKSDMHSPHQNSFVNCHTQSGLLA